MSSKDKQYYRGVWVDSGFHERLGSHAGFREAMAEYYKHFPKTDNDKQELPDARIGKSITEALERERLSNTGIPAHITGGL